MLIFNTVHQLKPECSSFTFTRLRVKKTTKETKKNFTIRLLLRNGHPPPPLPLKAAVVRAPKVHDKSVSLKNCNPLLKSVLKTAG